MQNNKITIDSHEANCSRHADGQTIQLFVYCVRKKGGIDFEIDSFFFSMIIWNIILFVLFITARNTNYECKCSFTDILFAVLFVIPVEWMNAIPDRLTKKKKKRRNIWINTFFNHINPLFNLAACGLWNEASSYSKEYTMRVSRACKQIPGVSSLLTMSMECNSLEKKRK